MTLRSGDDTGQGAVQAGGYKRTCNADTHRQQKIALVISGCGFLASVPE
jgi:hypothetical protein